MRWKVFRGPSTSQRHRGFLCASWRQNSEGRKQKTGRKNHCRLQTPTVYPPSPPGLSTDFKTLKGRLPPAHRAATTDGRVSSVLPDTLHVEANTRVEVFLFCTFSHIWRSSTYFGPHHHASAREVLVSPAPVSGSSICCLSGPLSRTSCCV